jgi:RecA-family ATPase
MTEIRHPVLRQVAAEQKPSPPSWRDNVFSASNLKTMTFTPINWVVPGIIPEGLTILAGKPKIGKSWLALDIALAIAGGRFVLGNIKPEQGDVLYAALEDNKRRLWKRIRQIIAAADIVWPEQLTLATRWRQLDQGGARDIQEWADTVSKPRLVILDTLAGVKPDRNARDSIYDGDYRALRELHAWANEVGIPVLILHHTRKMEADDPIDTISGSLGLAGCADTSVILSRNQKGTTLYLRGRDVEEQEHAMLFNAETCRWTILGDAAEVLRSDSRGKILDALSEATDFMTPSDIVAATGLGRQNVDQLLHRMKSDGEIIKRKRGLYAHASRPDLVSSG